MNEKVFPSPEEVLREFPLEELKNYLLEIDASQMGLEIALARAKGGYVPSIRLLGIDIFELANNLHMINKELEKLYKEGKITEEEYRKLRDAFDIHKGFKLVNKAGEEIDALLEQKVKEVVG